MALEQALRITVGVDGGEKVQKLSTDLDAVGASGQKASAGIASAGQGAGAALPHISSLAGEANRLQGVFQSAGSGASGLLSSISALGGATATLLPLTAAVIGLGVAFKAISVGVSSAMEAADTLHNLDEAVKRTGTSVSQAAPQIEAAIQKVFDFSAFDDEPLRKAAATFVTITGNARQASDAIQPIADLASAMGVDLDSSARLIAKAAEGMTGALQRAGIIFSDEEQAALKAADANEKLALVFAKIEQKVGGAAAAELGTYAGQVANMKKNWDEAAESLGSIFLPALSTGLAVLTSFAKGVKEILDVTTEVIDNFKLLQLVVGFFQKGNTGGASGTWDVAPKAAPKEDAAGAAALALALAKANEQAIATRKNIDGLFGDLAKTTLKIDVGFRVPTDDPVQKAVQAVHDKAVSDLADVADKTNAMTGLIVSGLAHVRTLQAEIASERAKDKPDPNAILGLQQEAAETLKLVTGARQARDAYSQLPDAINAGATVMERVAADNVLAKMAEEAHDKFLHITDGLDQELATALAAFKELPASIGGPASDQFASLFKTYSDDVRNAIEAGLSDADLSSLLESLKRNFKAGSQPIIDSAKAAGEEWKHAFDEAAQRLQRGVDNFNTGMQSIFTDLALTGGKNFGQIAGQMFTKSVENGAQDLQKVFNSLVLGAFGAKNPDKSLFQDDQGNWLGEGSQAAFQKQQTQADEQNAKVSGAVGGFVGMLGNAINTVTTQQKQLLNVGAAYGTGAVSGALAGASFGWIGAAIGAVVGALLGGISAAVANKKTMASMPYATYGVRDGEAYVEAMPGFEKNFENVTAKDLLDMQRGIKESLSKYANGFVQMLQKFPSEMVARLDLSLGNLDYTPTMDAFWKTVQKRSWWQILLDPAKVNLLLRWTGLGQTSDSGTTKGDIRNPNLSKQDAFDAMKQMPSDFENFTKNLLPAKIFEFYKPQVASAFTAMGMTVDQFARVWGQISMLDPEKGMAVLNDMADALIAFNNATTFGASISEDFGQASKSGTRLSAKGYAVPEGVSEFSESMIEAGHTVLDQMVALKNAVGIEAIASAGKALGDSLTKVKDGLITFLNSVLQTQQALHQFFTDKLFQSSLDAAKTPQEKSDLLTNRYLEDRQKIQNAVGLGLSPAQVDQYARDAAGLLDQLIALDPSKRRDWFDQQIRDLDQISQKSLDALAKQGIDQYNAIINTAQGSMDYLNGKIQDTAGPAIDDLSNAADSASEALNNLALTAGGKGADKGKGSYYDSPDYHRRHDAPETDGGTGGAGGSGGTGGYNANLVGQASGLGGGGRGAYSGTRPGDGTQAAVDALVTAARALTNAAAPPPVGTAGGGLADFAATSTHAGFEKGKFTYAAGTDPGLHAYLIENALSYMHGGGKTTATDTRNANPIERNTAATVTAIDRQTRVLERLADTNERVAITNDRMATAIENGEHINMGDLTINLQNTSDGAMQQSTATQRAQFARTLAARGSN